MSQTIDYSPLARALDSLQDALDPPPRNDRERDGAIQRFEYTFELSWKFIRRALISLGRANVSASPKPLIRSAQQEGFLSDVDLWFGFLDARNAATHLYNRNVADDVFEVVKKFTPEGRQLLQNLRQATHDPG